MFTPMFIVALFTIARITLISLLLVSTTLTSLTALSHSLLLTCSYTWKKDFPDGALIKNNPSLDQKIPWRMKWQPIPVFFPGKFHGERSLVSYSPSGHKELDMAEHTLALYLEDVSIEYLLNVK